jgi:hypothetical protein
MKRATATKEAA